MIESARLAVIALCSALFSAPLVAWGEEKTDAVAEGSSKISSSIENLRTQVESLLASTSSDLGEVEDLLFNDPTNPDLLALAKDLRASITQLTVLLDELPDRTVAAGSD